MKKLMLNLLPWLIVLAGLAALIIFVFVPIYSQNDDTILEAPAVFFCLSLLHSPVLSALPDPERFPGSGSR